MPAAGTAADINIGICRKLDILGHFQKIEIRLPANLIT
jgi:hypothetical protein